jgi:uncharacterized membrane protein SirB2
MDYLLLKSIHVSCVAITFAFFFGRGVLTLRDSPLPDARFLRIVPHVNDTLLLCSATWMAISSSQYPFADSWLTAKLVALFVYVGAGIVALSRRRTKRVRLTAWIFSLLVFAYMVCVALAHDPLPFIQR